MKFLTIIPAYNEEAYIVSVVGAALKYSDVLVVDDGSTDNTSVLSKKAGAEVISHDTNKGKGASLKTGIEHALLHEYAAVVMLDGDGQHNPQYIPEMAKIIDQADLVICSRFLNETPENMAIQRRISNKLTTFLLEKATQYQITDSQCGFRMFNDKAARIFVQIPYDDYEFESEMLYMASLNDLVYKETAIPSTYRGEKSYITGINIVKYIYYLFKLFFRSLKWRIKN